MPAQFIDAPDVRAIAGELIPQHHAHLLDYHIPLAFVFRDDVPTKGGHEVWGTARKVSGLNAFLVNHADKPGQKIEELNAPFFVIVISLPIWQRIKPRQQRALVDHELSHCWAAEDEDGNVKLSITGHDRELFVSEIDRHGLWDEQLQAIGEAVMAHMPGPVQRLTAMVTANGSNGEGSHVSA